MGRDDELLHVLSEYQRRCGILYELVGMNACEAAIARALVDYPGPWAVKTLSGFIGFPRSTVRGRIADLVVMGLATEGRDGVDLTPCARRQFEIGRREGHEIVMGLRRGVSARSAEWLERAPHAGVARPFKAPHRLRSISFAPLRLMCADRRAGWRPPPPLSLTFSK